MKRPSESEYTSHVAYTRALEEYCDSLPQLAQEPAPAQIQKSCKLCTHEQRDYLNRLLLALLRRAK